MSTSRLIHIAIKDGMAGNCRSVPVRKTVISKAKQLKKGKTLKLNSKVVKQSAKLNAGSQRTLKYESSNRKIATVN